MAAVVLELSVFPCWSPAHLLNRWTRCHHHETFTPHFTPSLELLPFGCAPPPTSALSIFIHLFLASYETIVTKSNLFIFKSKFQEIPSRQIWDIMFKRPETCWCGLDLWPAGHSWVSVNICAKFEMILSICSWGWKWFREVTVTLTFDLHSGHRTDGQPVDITPPAIGCRRHRGIRHPVSFSLMEFQLLVRVKEYDLPRPSWSDPSPQITMKQNATG